MFVFFPERFHKATLPDPMSSNLNIPSYMQLKNLLLSLANPSP